MAEAVSFVHHEPLADNVIGRVYWCPSVNAGEPFNRFNLVMNSVRDWSYDIAPGPAGSAEGLDYYAGVVHELGHGAGMWGHLDDAAQRDDVDTSCDEGLGRHTMCGGRTVEQARHHRYRTLEPHDVDSFAAHYPINPNPVDPTSPDRSSWLSARRGRSPGTLRRARSLAD